MLLGKSRLSRLGSSTLPTAMPEPITQVPKYRHQTEPSERSTMPPAMRISAPNRVGSRPYSRASMAENGEIRAKASSGRVVRMPASALDRPNSGWISPSSGATPVTGARRLAAISRMPRISSAGRATEAVKVRVFMDRASEGKAATLRPTPAG